MHSAAEAVSRARDFRPDVVLCDLHLGRRRSGYEVARELRRAAIYRGARLFAITGFDPERCLTAAREAGFDGVLPKPIDFRHLESVIRQPAESPSP